MAEHKDPQWWMRCKPVLETGVGTMWDLCDLCGHARGLHMMRLGGCTAHSTALVGGPHPCDCTNKGDGSIFRDPTTLRQLTAR